MNSKLQINEPYLKKWLMDFDSENLSLAKIAQEELVSNLIKQMNNFFIEGLKLKGYEFQNENQVQLFIGEMCHCVEDMQTGIKVYYVEDEPFLMYKENISLEHNFQQTEKETTISASLGHWNYL